MCPILSIVQWPNSLNTHNGGNYEIPLGCVMVCLFKHTYIVRFGKLEPLSHFMIFVQSPTFLLCSGVILSDFQLREG